VARRPERVGTDDGPSLRERNCAVENTAQNGRVKVAGTPSLSVGPVVRRRYRNVVVAFARFVEQWPDWEVRRDSVATCQELGWASDMCQVQIAHWTELDQTLRRLYDVEMNRMERDRERARMDAANANARILD
jgi:hypothetical protein